MSVHAWPFLVSCNKYLEYRTVVAPEFICRAGVSQLLSQATSGDLTQPNVLLCRQIPKAQLKFTLVYRIKKLTKEDLALETNETPTDAGRPILLVEGIVLEGLKANELKSRKIAISGKNIDEVHESLLSYYRQFWEKRSADGLPYETSPLELKQEEFFDIEVLQPFFERTEQQDVKTSFSKTPENDKDRQSITAKNRQLDAKESLPESFKPPATTTNVNKFKPGNELNAKKRNNQICSVDFSPNGKTIAVRSDTQLIWLWKPETNQIDQLIKKTIDDYWGNPIRFYSSVVFSPDGKILASVFKKQTAITLTETMELKLWDLSCSKKEQDSISVETDPKSDVSIAFSPDGQTIATSSNNCIMVYNRVTKAKNLLSGYKAPIRSIAINQTSSPLIAMGDDNGFIKVWSLTSRKLINSIPEAHSSSINSVAFSSDGQILASGSQDRSIKLFKAENDYTIRTINVGSAVKSVAFSPDDRLIVSGNDDNTIKLWDAETGKLIDTLRKHQAAVTSVAFSPDGRTLASGSADCTAITWCASD